MGSNELIEQLQYPVRNQAHARVSFFIIDPDTNPTITSETQTKYSDIDTMRLDTITQTENYATLENNFWVLDGSLPLYGGKETPQGYVSSYISDENGDYSEYPNYILQSDDYLTTVGLTITFDSITEEYATNIYVKAYRDEVLIVNKNYPIEKYIARIVFADSDELVQWNRIEIYFTGTNLPYRRVRVNQFIIGVLKIYEDEQLMSCSSKEKTTMINSELPTHTFEFSIDNSDKLFNPDNPSGWYRYIMERQQVNYEWGYDLDDGTIEWIVGGYMKSTGEIDVSDYQATFQSTTTLNLMTDTYNKGTYNPDGRSLYDLAVDVLTDAGIESGSYELWSGLKNIYTEAALPQDEHRNLLQMIATASNCTLYTDRYDIIYIMPFEYEINSNSWDYTFIKTKPDITIQPQLYNSIVYINHYKISDEVTEIYKNEELLLEDTADVEVTYNLSTNISIEVTNGTLNSSETYGRYALLNITPNDSATEISIIITGNEISNSQTLDSMKYNVTGENIEYENDLVTPTLEKSKDTNLKVFLGDWYNNRNIYDFENRGDVTKDTREIFNVENEFTSNMVGYLVENNIDYNGAWNGDSTVMRIASKTYSDINDKTYQYYVDLGCDYYKIYASNSEL